MVWYEFLNSTEINEMMLFQASLQFFPDQFWIETRPAPSPSNWSILQ